MSSRGLFRFATLLAISCAGQGARVEDQPQTTAPPTAAPSAAPIEEPSAEPMPDHTAAPTAEVKKAPPPAGRPAILKGPTKGPIKETFGSTPAATLKLITKDGDFTLKLPEGALSAGTNITFEAPGKTRGKPPVIGDTVHLALQHGEETRLSEIDSAGPPFTIIVPSKKKVNLAICPMELNEAGQETGKTKPCTVIEPLRFDEGLSQVVFERTHLAPCVMYATGAEATK